MSYTIEIRRPSKDGVNSKVAGQFTDFVWNSLWGDLQVPRRQWESWQSEQENTPLLADLPEVSKLAYIDEGAVHFSPMELSKECIRLMPALSSDAARQLIRSLINACEIALIGERDADLVVHPFPE